MPLHTAATIMLGGVVPARSAPVQARVQAAAPAEVTAAVGPDDASAGPCPARRRWPRTAPYRLAPEDLRLVAATSASLYRGVVGASSIGWARLGPL
ncbi:MAG: hypothetical protein GEV11_05460 [Streptosporangiales bacterium]|nr:hypothetical protein [Streptosporangiales bacterium]